MVGVAKAAPVVGQYTLGETLGTGSCSKVKSAVHNVTGEVVAVKMVKKATEGEQDARTEIKVMGMLQELGMKAGESNITRRLKADSTPLVRFKEVMESSKFIYVVMEKVDAGDLFAHCTDFGLLNDADARYIFRRLLKGMDTLHQSGVAHRDIKLENILVDMEEAVVKLSDFGLARIHAEPEVAGDCETYSCQPVGTRNYAAPELLVKSPRYNAYKADMYSLGVAMHVALTGEFPPADGFVHSVERHESVSEDASSLMAMLMHKYPTKRPSARDALFHPFFDVAESDKSSETQ